MPKNPRLQFASEKSKNSRNRKTIVTLWALARVHICVSRSSSGVVGSRKKRGREVNAVETWYSRGAQLGEREGVGEITTKSMADSPALP